MDYESLVFLMKKQKAYLVEVKDILMHLRRQ